MNWRYLRLRLIIVAVAWTFFAFAFDPLVRMGLVSSSQLAAGARVDVGGLQTKFFPPKLTMKNVHVANRFRSGRNLVEFGKLNINIRGDALLMKRFVVESGEITNIRIGDPRPDDGRLEESESDDGPSVLDGYSEQFRNMGARWLDDLAQQAKLELDPEQLETYRVGEQIHEKWDRRMQLLREQVHVLRPQVKQVETLIKGAKHSEPLVQVQQYTQAASDTQTLLRTAQQLTTEFRGIPAEFKADLQSLNQARANDQQMIKSKAQLLKPDPTRITELLFGPTMTQQLKQALAWLTTARKYKQALIGSDLKPQRQRGMDILFPLYEEHPVFLMKGLKLSGNLSLHDEQMPFQATIGGITSDPVLHGKPIVLKLMAKGESELQFQAEFDRTGVQEINRLVLITRDARITQHELGNPSSLAVGLSAGSSDWKCQFEMVDNKLQGAINLAQIGVAMKAYGDKVKHPVLQRVLADVLGSVNQLDVTLNVAGTPTAPRLAVSSSLGPQISTGLQTALLNEVDVQKQELAIKAQQFATQQIASVQSRLSSEYTKLAGEHKDLMESIQLVQSLVPAGGLRQMRPRDVIRTASQNRVVREKVSDAIRGSGATDKLKREFDRFGGLGNLGGLLPPHLRPRSGSK